jgi:hypothetical protein
LASRSRTSRCCTATPRSRARLTPRLRSLVVGGQPSSRRPDR